VPFSDGWLWMAYKFLSHFFVLVEEQKDHLFCFGSLAAMSEIDIANLIYFHLLNNDTF
jgi:hypothetical protein